MSIRVMTVVWDSGRYEGGELLVLLALADWANDQGQCWPSIPAIARKARLKERQVYNILRKMRAEGVISYEPGGGRGNPSRYVLNTAMVAGFKDEKTLQPSAEKPCNPVQKNPAVECKSPTPPNRNNRQLTVKEPPSAKAKERRAEIKIAVAHVTTQCGFTSAELGNILADQIALGLERGKDAQSLATDMVTSWRLYQDENHLLRYTWGPVKFFGEGQWRSQNGWPYDQELARRAREAAVGARRR